MGRRDDLLVEIGMEELPHSFIPDAVKEFRERFTGLLKAQKIDFGEVELFSTPRRIALFISDVRTRQEDYAEEKRGPSASNAWLPNGKPSRALEGFLKAHQVNEDDIVVKAVDNREYVFLVKEIRGKETVSLLTEILDQSLRALTFPKNMRWENSGFRFARPIRWILFLFGERIVPFTLAGISSADQTFGHRSYSQGPIQVPAPAGFQKLLLDHSVVADRSLRKSEIQKQVGIICKQHGLLVPESAYALYDANTDLTEYPHAVLCSFDQQFLELPVEVLTSEMVEHQFYFPLVHRETGALSNHFIAISNIRKNSETQAGYERVLRARLDDGRFFFHEDRKKGFALYSRALGAVTFHEKLGSMQEKVERIVRISDRIAGQLGLPGEKREHLLTTARLCKNDLVTLMVGEFPALQGIMGCYYAREAGYPEEVALGIREHYYPRFASDLLPSRLEGAVVGIADRLDTILGIFSIGLKPTGSRDPFALRRKVFGIVKILISQELNFSMRGLIEDLLGSYIDRASSKNTDEPDVVLDIIEALNGFFLERIRSIFTDMGFAYDEINASLGRAMEDIYEAYRRVEALHRYRERSDFQNMLISFRRMGNILTDEGEYRFSEDLLREEAEKALHRYFLSVKDEIAEQINSKNYEKVYALLSSFKPYVDTFFDKVLVMDEDLALRANRIALLKSIVDVFSDIIDISKIVSG